MNSDVDANNIYHRASDNEEDFFEIMYVYNMEVENGETNRVDEFLKFYGGGDAEKGLEYIKEDLEDVDVGSYYMGATVGSLDLLWI